MLRIGIFTGSRANYSSTKTIIKSLAENTDIELYSIVGGAATLQRYGAIDKAMVREGLPKPDFKFNMFIDGESNADMAKSAGLGLMEMSSILNIADLSALIVVGDRYDILSPVLAAALMNVPIIHTMGGEVTGTIDESIRHAVTKFAHLHLVANDDARRRVIKLGEPEDTVFSVGCPRMDLVRESVKLDCLTSELFRSKYPGVGCEINLNDPFLLVSFHPVTTELSSVRNDVEEMLYALNELAIQTILLWPNFDAGSSLVSKAIRTFREKLDPKWLNVQTNFSIEDYNCLMNKTACLIGNSSSGIREGAFLGTPVVNIGTRQTDRLKSSNVLDVEPKKQLILRAIIDRLEHGRFESSDLYGDGFTGPRIVEIVKNFDFQKVQKKIAY